jgi:hypothetical protein
MGNLEYRTCGVVRGQVRKLQFLPSYSIKEFVLNDQRPK